MKPSVRRISLLLKDSRFCVENFKLKGIMAIPIYSRFRDLVSHLARKNEVGVIKDIFFPKFYLGGQPNDSEFFCIQLEDGSCGISFVLLPDHAIQRYAMAASSDYQGTPLLDLVNGFGSVDPVTNMIGLAAVNAVCQSVMRQTGYPLDTATDSVGELRINGMDHVGMVGLFRPIIKEILETGAQLTILEQNQSLILKYPEYNITTNVEELRQCGKILCTSTVVYNNTLDSILDNCSQNARISIIGPTAGYFPDPLFDQGVDFVGGTFIEDGDLFMKNLRDKTKWGISAKKISFSRHDYKGLPN